MTIKHGSQRGTTDYLEALLYTTSDGIVSVDCASVANEQVLLANMETLAKALDVPLQIGDSIFNEK